MRGAVFLSLLVVVVGMAMIASGMTGKTEQLIEAIK
jgi:hypothetical protein